jgi:hypothetical protein
MSDKPFDAEVCDIGGQASARNSLTDVKNGLSDMKNAPCNRPLKINYIFKKIAVTKEMLFSHPNAWVRIQRTDLACQWFSFPKKHVLKEIL